MDARRTYGSVALLLAATISAAGCGGAASSATSGPRPVYRDADFATLISIANAWTGAALRANGQLRMYWAGDEDSRHVDARLFASRSGALYIDGRRGLTGQLFELVSNGSRFEIKIPDHAAVYTGTPALEVDVDPERPYFALRPHHMTEALLPEPLPTTSTPGSWVLVEEYPDRYGLVWMMADNSEAAIRRRVWIERVGLRVSEIEVFGDDGRIEFIALYSAYLGPAPDAFPGRIEVQRPWEELTFRFDLESAEINPIVPAAAFRFKESPPGYRTLTIEQAMAELRARGERW